MLIINAVIKTMDGAGTGKEYSNGFVQAVDGKITAVGSMDELVRQEDEIFDAKGGLLLPGFIDSHCHLGMWEDGLGFEGDDGNEDTDPLTPQLRAVDAINPFDRCFAEALQAGVTTVVTGPGSANPIGGEWAAMKTYGRCVDDMVVKAPVGMKFALGENPKTSYHAKGQTPVTRMATAALIREQLKKAERYIQDKERAASDEEFDEPEYDAKCEALIPVLQRKIKAFFHAHRADDICTAIRLAKEFRLDYVLIHCTEGHLIPEILKREQAAAIIGPVLCDRSKPELRQLSPALGGLLEQQGISFGLCTDHPVIPVQYLTLSGIVAGAEGLSATEALRAMTCNAAELCGIGDRVGRIAVGLDADFVLFDQNPMTAYIKPTAVFAAGRRVCGGR